jgi:type 1 fimbria pilin
MKKRLYTLLTAIVCISTNIFGQATATGTIQGTVSDPTQAVVAGAGVDLTRKATGEKRKHDDGRVRKFSIRSACRRHLHGECEEAGVLHTD